MNSLQLLVLVVTLFLAIVGVYWGVKQMRRRKYERIKTRLRYQTFGDDETGEEFSSELPGGGARVVAHRDPEDIHTVNKRIREQAEANKPKLSINPHNLSEQGALDLGAEEVKQTDPHIPVLLDPAEDIGEAPIAEEPVPEQQMPEEELAPIVEPIIDQTPVQNGVLSKEEAQDETQIELAEEPVAEEHIVVTEEPEIATSEPEQEKPDHSILFSDPETTERNPERPEPPVADEQVVAEQTFDSPQSAEPAEPQPVSETKTEPVAEGQVEHHEAEVAPEPEPDEVIIINLMCTEDGDEFLGTELWAALEGQGLEHGYMDIFHFDSGTGADTVRFSAANILNPGTFPTEKLEYFYTPGICFFMTMTAGVSNLQAFNQLLSAARGVASKLGGELKDQDRAYLTHQRVEEIRTRMGEFQREKLLG